MTIASFTIKQSSLLPSLSLTLRDDEGKPVNLEDVESVQFRLRRVGRTDALFTRAMTIVDEALGKVRYDWQTGDTDTSGMYEGEVLVTIQGRPQSFPGDGFILVEISPNAALDSSDPDAGLIFCTSTQARDIVRKDVNLDNLALAQTVISLHTGVVPDSTPDSYYSTLDDQDQLGLRQATAFQAIWLASQPDYLTRINVSREGDNSESRTYTKDALILNTLAQYALRNTRFASALRDSSVDTPRDRTVNARVDVTEVGWVPWGT